jgi:hypothetical protein
LRPAVAEHTTATYLSVLGLRPSLGRWFDAAEDTARRRRWSAVVGHQAWIEEVHGGSVGDRPHHPHRRRAGHDRRGLAPQGTGGTINIGIVTDFWLPISSLPARRSAATGSGTAPEEAAFSVKARLRDGVTVAQAQAAMNILGRAAGSRVPEGRIQARALPCFAASDVRIHPQMDGLLRAVASLLLVVVGLVLAIACSNLATLLLVRGAARAKEVSFGWPWARRADRSFVTC